MAEKHAESALLALETLMAPVREFHRALENPERRAALDNLEVLELFKLCLAAAGQLPRLQETERAARGCKIVDANRMSNPVNAQGGHEWQIAIDQPPRPEGIREDPAHKRRYARAPGDRRNKKPRPERGPAAQNSIARICSCVSS